MRRLLLTLCLRAYPPAGRERDRNYLLDLALELSETYGVRRQAMSLVRGGIGERLASRRLRRGAGASMWIRRVVVVCLALAATAVATGDLTGWGTGDGARVEVDRFECVQTVEARGNAPERMARSPIACGRAGSARRVDRQTTGGV